MVVAATVAEWLGGTKGLGVYMVRAKSAYALDKVFASTIIVVVLSLIFVGLVNIAKKIIIKHKYSYCNALSAVLPRKHAKLWHRLLWIIDKEK